MNELRQALGRAKAGFWGVALFTGVVNVLMLTGPLFMLQIYDRVLASHSTATLLVLFLIVVFLFGLMGILDHVRGRVLARIGAGFQAALDGRVFATVLRQAEVPKLREQPAGALRDLAAIQSLLASAGTGAVFDLPWAPLYLAIMFMFHVWLGWFAVAGMLLVPFALLMLLGVLYFQLHAIPAVDRVLLGVVAAAAGLALSMGFRILRTYRRDPLAWLLAALTFTALQGLHLSLISVVLVLGPLAMLLYWPRAGVGGTP